MVLKCPKCPAEFPSNRDLQKHLARKLPCDSEKCRCTGCDRPFQTKKNLKAHLKKGRCKGKKPTIREMEQQMQQSALAHESSVAALEVALQHVQKHHDALMLATDIPQARAVLKNLQQIAPTLTPSVDANGRLIMQSLIGTDFVKGQVYFGIPGVTPILQDADGTAIDVSCMEQFQVLKIGYKEQEEHDRFGDHSRDMGGFRVLDSMLTQFPVTLERQVLRYLRSEKLLVRAKFPDKRGIDKECALIRSHKEYADMITFVKEIAATIDKSTSSTDESLRSELELVKGQNISKETDARILEAEARKLEANARVLEAEARKLEAEAANKRADLELIKHQQM